MTSYEDMTDLGHRQIYKVEALLAHLFLFPSSNNFHDKDYYPQNIHTTK